jgi:hypothetical protein
MKRIGLSVVAPALGLLLGLATPATASAQGWHGGGHGAAPVAHASGGWHGAPVTRPAVVHNVAVGPRGFAGRPVYVHPGYAGHYVGPVAGHWGFHGGTRVWFGVATVAPYPGWIWTPGTWVWDGYQWVWQDGYWAAPAY